MKTKSTTKKKPTLEDFENNKRDRTERQIHAALHLLNACGTHGVTLDTMCKVHGISHETLMTMCSREYIYGKHIKFTNGVDAWRLYINEKGREALARYTTS